MQLCRICSIALAISLIACAGDTGDVGFGVSGVVLSASTHEPIINAWAAFDDTIPGLHREVDSTGIFSIATWGCGTRDLFFGAPGYKTYDTTVTSYRCRSIDSVVIELTPSS